MAEQTQTLRPQVTATAGGGKGHLWSSKRFQENLATTVATIIATLGLVIVLLPLFWMLSTSLKGQVEALQMPPKWIPAKLQWQNYYDVLTINPFGLYFRNTIFFAV